LASGRFQADPSAVAEIAAHQIPQSRPAHARALKPQSAMLRDLIQVPQIRLDKNRGS